MVRKIIATLLLLAVPALPAFAKNSKSGEHGNGNGHSEKSHGGNGHDWDDDDDDDHGPRFSSHDYDSWRVYWGDQYDHGHCPPGLAKKHNGCMPPGQAKKRYVIGRPLPVGVVVLPVPVVLLPMLSPCPPGYRYGMIDGDLVQLAVGTMLVVDALNGLLH